MRAREDPGTARPARTAVLPITITIAALLAAASGQGAAAAPAGEGRDWPSFRGPNASGVSEGTPTPTRWSVETGENVRWRTRIPGLANSSPVVWGERIYLTTAVMEDDAELFTGRRRREYSDAPYAGIQSVPEEGRHRFQVLCVDKASGEVLWTRTANERAPRFKRHPKGTHANATPATDGERVVAFFGSEGLYCYDAGGELLWEKDLGDLEGGFYKMPEAQWGTASSPVIHGGRVIVLCDVLGLSFLAAFDVQSGAELWRVPRDDVPTWGTPTVDAREGRSQILISGHGHTGGYDLETGEEIWRLGGGGDLPIPTPIVACDLFVVTSAHGRMSPLWVIRASATGEIRAAPKGNEHMAWCWPHRGSSVSTPLAYGRELYVCTDQGMLVCFDLFTGEQHYRGRLFGSEAFSSSPVAAQGKIYVAGESGDVHVVRAGTEFELLATNELGEPCMATPAISEGTLYWRTQGHLVAVALDPGR